MLFLKSLHIYFFHIDQVYVLGMKLQTCFSMFVHIMCLRTKTVHYWGIFTSLLVIHHRRNACFSQRFEKRTFGYLNEEEESLFTTLTTFDSFCSSCSNFVTLSSSIIVTVVTAHGLNQLGLDNNMWPLFVTEMHKNPGRLNCANCDTQSTEHVLRNHAIRKTLLHGCDKIILLF